MLPEEMDHNNLDILGDFIAPLSEFLENFSIITHNDDKHPSYYSKMRSTMPVANNKKTSKKDNHRRTPLIDINNVDEYDSLVYKDSFLDEDPLENCEIEDND